MRRTILQRIAAATAAALILAACGGADGDATTLPTDPQATPVQPTETQPTETQPADDTTEPDDPASPTEGDTQPAEDTSGDLEGVDVVPEGQELVLRIDGEVHVIGLLDPEGESFYRYATIRPGSTRDDMTILALTQAEGMYDLRWLTYRAGEASEVQALPLQYQPNTELAAAVDAAPIPVWSPEGRSVAYLDWNAEGDVQLRTFGWSDGPGTGDTADDNAAFGLDLPAGVQLQRWEAGSGDTSTLYVLNEEGRTWTITVERQGDGALALGPDALQPAD